jgi:hypothetical protein
MANLVLDNLRSFFRRFSRPVSTGREASPPASVPAPLTAAAALTAFVAALKAKITHYLETRHDSLEQEDHLCHVAARARWLYANELQRTSPNTESVLSPRDNDLIEASVLSHDMGKWIPRDELHALFSEDQAQLDPVFGELNFSANQTELFLLGIRRRFNLPKDGYTPEYDAAHHLVSAYILVTDPALRFHALAAEDQAQLLHMVIGHQFGSYFKGSLLNLSLHDREVTTGMLVDSARSDRLAGDILSCVFHDADISDLLSVGSVENLAEGEEKFHSGGLVKILLINFTNLLHEAPYAPGTLEECLQSCQSTVSHACKEFLTPTAVECGRVWREEARGFLDYLQAAFITEALNAALTDQASPVRERLAQIRALIYSHAQAYLKESQGN